MRALFPVLLLLIAGALVAVFAVAIGAAALPVFIGYIIGVIAMVALSAYVNTRNANLYGRRTYEDVYFREESDRYWQPASERRTHDQHPEKFNGTAA